MAITMIWDFDSDTPLSIRDNIMRVDWYNAGEGLCGDYDPDDPQDINLLRFDVYVLGEKETEHGSDDGWKEVEDASYCTNVPANSAHEILEESLKYIFSEYRGVIDQYPHNSFRRLGERLSWISDLDFMSEPQRSIMKEFMTKMIPVEPKEYFPFHCQQCGACCRHVKESVPLESLDAFRLAKYLRDRGEAIQCMDDVLAKYAVPVLLHESGYMVFMLGTVGPDDACIFLR